MTVPVPIQLIRGRHRRPDELPRDKKPPWLRVQAPGSPDYLRLKRLMRSLSLTTVCEEANCTNLGECWSHGTATFMILGDRCTRACGFCLINTQPPFPSAPNAPQRVADAVSAMGLDYAVGTMVARDDLPDGGAQHIADTVSAIRKTNPSSGTLTSASTSPQ